jgi:hypothetical protein
LEVISESQKARLDDLQITLEQSQSLQAQAERQLDKLRLSKQIGGGSAASSSKNTGNGESSSGLNQSGDGNSRGMEGDGSRAAAGENGGASEVNRDLEFLAENRLREIEDYKNQKIELLQRLERMEIKVVFILHFYLIEINFLIVFGA